MYSPSFTPFQDIYCAKGEKSLYGISLSFVPSFPVSGLLT